MNLLPKASGTRPRVACEIAPQGIAAARSDAPTAPLAAIASAPLDPGALAPGLKPGNLVDRLAVVAALRKAFDAIGARPNTRSSDITLIVPDGATRVLLLDFDSLPNKLTEALPLVRFRLKKLLPFDSDDAMVTFQVMSTSKTLVRVLAVAIPRDVLAEYESAAREAGFEPGSVLPSTLASLAAVDDAGANLIVNVTSLGITTAITRDGILLLHRTVDLQLAPVGVPINVPTALLEDATGHVTLPLVSHEDTLAEWAAQEPLPEHGRNPYATPAAEAEAATQTTDSITGFNIPGIFVDDAQSEFPALAPIPVPHQEEPLPVAVPEEPHIAEPLPPADFANEVSQAISVAAAYFEDTLSTPPATLLTAGSLNAQALFRILTDSGLTEADGLKTRDLISADSIAADAISSRVPRSWLAGVTGALRG